MMRQFSKKMKILTTLKTSKKLTTVILEIKSLVAAANSEIREHLTQRNQVKVPNKVGTSVEG
jgi:hypothetical protein